MVYKSIYQQLCREKIVNLVCDKQRYVIVWGFDELLHRAPILLAKRWFKGYDEAITYLSANESKVLQGFNGFTLVEDDFLLRKQEVTAVDLKAVEVARQHTDCCPLCGHKLS